MRQLKWDNFIGVNETSDKLGAGQIPFGVNIDFGNPIGTAKKRDGLYSLFTSLGTGGIQGIHTYRRSSGDIVLFGHGTDCYKTSGDSSTIVKTTDADFNAGTHDETVAEATGILVTDVEVVESNEDKRTGELVLPLEVEEEPQPTTTEEVLADLIQLLVDKGGIY